DLPPRAGAGALPAGGRFRSGLGRARPRSGESTLAGIHGPAVRARAGDRAGGAVRDDEGSLLSGVTDDKDVAHAITRDPETMHGIPVFRGTRVPVQTLFDYLEGGDTLEDFLEGFPTVPRSLALEALEEAKQLLLARG